MSAVVTSTPLPGPSGRYGVRNLARFVRGPLPWLRGLATEHGDIVRLKMFGSCWFLVSHPDDIERILVKDARVMKRDAGIAIVRRVLGNGLLTSEGDLWKRQRKLMSQAFTPKRIAEYATAMVRVGDVALERWRDGGEINLHQEMSQLTMVVVADVLFGASMDAADVEAVSRAMEVVNEFFSGSPEAMLQVPKWVPTPRNLGMNRAVASLDRVVYDIIAKRREGLGDSHEPVPRDYSRGLARSDLLGTLLAARDDDDAGMSDVQLRDEVMTLFLAGHETTSLTLAHALYLLSLNPAIEQRLHDETTKALGDRLPTAEDARSLSFAEWVLKETMRLYPPAWSVGRETVDPYELRGHAIPVGSQLVASQWIVHRDARWYPDPERFDPERWSPERAKDIPRYAYFPFGGGPRVCIGNHFAMMEATLLLAMIVKRFRVELLPGERLELAPAVTLRQKGEGLRARTLARN
ncbi:MAG: cytochrome P450 [Polyangiaceae bacterium]